MSCLPVLKTRASFFPWLLLLLGLSPLRLLLSDGRQLCRLRGFLLYAISSLGAVPRRGCWPLLSPLSRTYCFQVLAYYIELGVVVGVRGWRRDYEEGPLDIS